MEQGIGAHLSITSSGSCKLPGSYEICPLPPLTLLGWVSRAVAVEGSHQKPAQILLVLKGVPKGHISSLSPSLSPFIFAALLSLPGGIEVSGPGNRARGCLLCPLGQGRGESMLSEVPCYPVH